MEDFFLHLMEGRRVVSIVGGGGKSSLMDFLARLLTAQGRRVGVITSTRIGRPQSLCRDKAACLACWARGTYAVCGTDAEPGKITLPEPELLAWLLHTADAVLCEADGAKRLPCKAPAAHEPVILAQSDLVIGVMGMDALGRRVDEICHRPEQVCALLGCAGDHILTGADMAAILLSPLGTRKNVGDRAYCVVLNKCDDAERFAKAQGIAQLLARQGQTCVALTQFGREATAQRDLVIVRGGGDMATAVAHRLHSAGFPVLVLEAAHPAAIRRQVAFSEAVYEGQATVEGVTAVRIADTGALPSALAAGCVPVMVDPEGLSIAALRPAAVVDAIIAKRNLGTTRDMAPLTIALGPGFCAGRDVHYVVETMRGHNLGRIIREGYALPNTGVPGKVGGYAAERVIHAQHAGVLTGMRRVGDMVERGETIAVIADETGEYPVTATISGLIRGLIRNGFPVTEGFKIADIDPRLEEYDNCFTISDKARCIAGSVLELVCRHVRNAR